MAPCPCGGTGRRARLKIVFRKEWGFDSLHGHHTLLASRRAAVVYILIVVPVALLGGGGHLAAYDRPVFSSSPVRIGKIKLLAATNIEMLTAVTERYQASS
jgi:hypothetical protein